MKFHDIVECIELDQSYQERLHLESKHTIFPSSQYQEDIDAMPRENGNCYTCDHEVWRELDSKQVLWRNKGLQISCLRSLFTWPKGRDDRLYCPIWCSNQDGQGRKKIPVMICVQGIGASLNSSVEALDAVDGLGQTHHESLRSTKWELWGKEPISTPIPNIQPWASVIQQTLTHQNVSEYFQKDDAMKYSAEILDEEEVLQTTTCTPKDIYTDTRDGRPLLRWNCSPFRH